MLLLVAAFVESPYRELLWIAAAAIDVGGPLLAGVSGFSIMPGYFVERHGLIIRWSYFGLNTAAQERLLRSHGAERARLARDAYSYLHLPMVGGIVFFALGVDETLTHPTDPLPVLPAVALCGGVAVFYAADVAYRWRDHHRIVTDRTAAAVAAAVTFPFALSVPALASLAALAALGAARAAWEAKYGPLAGAT